MRTVKAICGLRRRRASIVSETVQPGEAPFGATARSPDGRLWFANGVALQMIDPGHLTGNALPPPVHVEQVVADRKNYSPPKDLRLPPLTRDLEIDYTALSFVVPQKVPFHYKLEGRDAAWEEPGSRRQAFYTDLGPGKYRFRVIACNNDGVWNNAGATLDFIVTPAWYQTNWFRYRARSSITRYPARFERLVRQPRICGQLSRHHQAQAGRGEDPAKRRGASADPGFRAAVRCRIRA
jgi:hypothetical protein